MSNILKITADVTAVAIGDPIALNKTPLLGGAGREAKYQIPVLPLTGVFALQGAMKDTTAGLPARAPAEDSDDWTDLLVVDADTDAVGEIADLPDYIRVNTTTADADGPDVVVYLEGVQ